MNTKNLPLSLNMAITLKTIEQVFKKNMTELSIELPTESFGILMIAYFNQGLMQQEIAEMAKKDKSAVLRQIDLLESKGLLQRKPDENDRRKNLIFITDEGKKIAQTIVHKEHQMFRSLLKGIKKREIETFERTLDILKKNVLLFQN